MVQPGTRGSPPGEVTGLEPDPRREGSVRVLVGGVDFCAIPLDAVAALGLRVGRLLDDPLREALGRAADDEAAFRTALRFLARRPFGRADLARRLRQKGHGERAVGAALTRAERLGLVDDERFAERFVASRSARGRGPARLRRDLLGMGVEPAVVEAALRAAEAAGVHDPARVEQLARARARQLRALPPVTRRRRLLAFLARRGFGGSTARDLVARVLAGEAAASGS